MALYYVVVGQIAQPLDVGQFTTALQQPPGGTETQSGIFVEGAPFQTSATVGQWVQTRSQGSVPLSCAVTTTSSAGVGAVSTQVLGSSGVFVGAGATGPSNTAHFTVTLVFQY